MTPSAKSTRNTERTMNAFDTAAWARLNNALPTLGLDESSDLFVFCPCGSDRHLRVYTLLAFELATRETASLILHDDERLHPILTQRPADDISPTMEQGIQWADRFAEWSQKHTRAIHCVGARSHPFSKALHERLTIKETPEIPFLNVDFSTDLPGDNANGMTVRALSAQAVANGDKAVFDHVEYSRFIDSPSDGENSEAYMEAAIQHQAIQLPMLIDGPDGVAWENDEVEHFITHGSRHVAALVNRILSVR